MEAAPHAGTATSSLGVGLEGGRDRDSRVGWWQRSLLLLRARNDLDLSPEPREGDKQGSAVPQARHGDRDLPNMAASPRPAALIGWRRCRSDPIGGERGRGRCVAEVAAAGGGDVESGHGRRGRAGPGAPRRHRAGAASGGAAAAGEPRGHGRQPGGTRGAGALLPRRQSSFTIGTGPCCGHRSAVTVGTGL